MQTKDSRQQPNMVIRFFYSSIATVQIKSIIKKPIENYWEKKNESYGFRLLNAMNAMMSRVPALIVAPHDSLAWICLRVCL